jgi:hypothetical protein
MIDLADRLRRMGEREAHALANAGRSESGGS